MPTANDENTDEIVFQSLIESAQAGDPDDQPPKPEEGVHQHVKDQPTYSKMMASLVDQVKKAVDEKKSETGQRLAGFISETQSHKDRILQLNKELMVKLGELETEEKRHITSESIHTGFDYSNVQKAKPGEAASKQTSSAPELLNPGAVTRDPLNRSESGQSSGADADIEDGPDPDEEASASKLGKEFAKIKLGDYRASHQFISEHPEVLTEKETDGLLVEAFSAELDGKPTYAQQCVHQALLLQYCKQLGKDGVALFFKRITTQGHQANKLFTDDVTTTYDRIRKRAKEIAAEREKEGEGEGVEQIQLHAVDANSRIHIQVPPPVTATSSEEEKAAREIFESFPPNLRKALETGKLDEINKVLGKMSVSEAEEVVEKLGDGGMLSLEQGVIDATTDEGKATVAEIEKTGRMPGRADDEYEELPKGMSEDPPLD